ncbi:LuxR C-terminal-related transcriptional regulator [Streptomyces sp. NPDC004232]|uniref:helix-turn-helix transcriptional regulator n=1 Tax=Streptomyces sp. NPDC004232 TaxID=3154454 RepID=UPI001D9D7EB3|nr:LuxR C-terminal-related transcriptional regulator [Streptomyces sp. tea 10]
MERGIRVVGRESDHKSIGSLLASVAEGDPTLLVIEGRAGMGKTTLLAELTRQARNRGFSVEFPAGLSAVAAPPESAALRPGVPRLMVVDGFEAAGAAELTALGDALARMAGPGHLWAVAVRPGRVSDSLHRMNPGHHVRVVRMQLGRLTKRDSMLLCAELSGARPSPELVGLVESAGGNPLLVTELVRGLLEEGGIEVLDGIAWLRLPALPQRIQILVRGYLSSFSEGSRHMLRVAAVLNTALRPAQLSSLAMFLGKSTATLMPLLDEALEFGLLMDSEGKLVFPGELLRRVVAESVPWSMRQALLHEARAQQVAVGEPVVGRSVLTCGEMGDSCEELAGVLPTHRSGTRTVGGGLPVPSVVDPAEAVDARSARGELTSRELEVLRCVAKAMSNRQVGRHLSITEGTVKRHMRNIFRKLDATSRIDAVNKVGSLISADSRMCA